ncbi:MAG TPA: hypothetical protein VEY95_06495 [Azospirillaceae bacterium]|nr:hypothetical protein [Azospirillaceae bacterium]
MGQRRMMTSKPRHRRSMAVLAAALILYSTAAWAEDLTEAFRKACQASLEYSPLEQHLQPPEGSPLAPYARFCHALVREPVLKFLGRVQGYACTLVLAETEDGLAPRPVEEASPDDAGAEAAQERGDPAPMTPEQIDANRAAFDALFGTPVRERIEGHVRDELIRAFPGYGGQFVDVYLLLDASGQVRVEYDRQSLLARVRRIDTPAEAMRVLSMKAGVMFGGCDALELHRGNRSFLVTGVSYHPGGCAPIQKLHLRITSDASVTEVFREEGMEAVCLDPSAQR